MKCLLCGSNEEGHACSRIGKMKLHKIEVIAKGAKFYHTVEKFERIPLALALLKEAGAEIMEVSHSAGNLISGNTGMGLFGYVNIGDTVIIIRKD